MTPPLIDALRELQGDLHIAAISLGEIGLRGACIEARNKLTELLTAAALSAQGQDGIVCAACDGAGEVYAANGTGPYNCYQGCAPGCMWPEGARFSVRDEPGEHDPCWLILPSGEMLALNHHALNGVDQARAQFIADACNAALAAAPPTGTKESE